MVILSKQKIKKIAQSYGKPHEISELFKLSTGLFDIHRKLHIMQNGKLKQAKLESGNLIL